MEIDDGTLTEEFETFGISISGPDVLDHLKRLCATHRLDASAMCLEWVAYAHSHKNKNCKLTQEHLEQMERSRLTKKEKPTISTPKPKAKPLKANTIYDLNTLEAAVAEEENLLDVYSTPDSKLKSTSAKRQHTPDQPTNKRLMGLSGSPATVLSPSSFSPVSATPSQKYSSRTNVAQVVFNYGDTTKVKWATQRATAPSITPYDPSQALSGKFKYMFQKLSDKAAVLNDMLDEMGSKLQKQHNIEEFSHVALPVQEQVTVVGRMGCDSVGKLNAKSVMLEGSRDTSAGRSIPVDLAVLKQYSIFPGQLVALDGINSTGMKFTATNIYQGAALPLPGKPMLKNGGLRVMVACGPYSTSDSLMYEPLADLIKAMQNSPPDICIMLGPFVDMKNPEIEKGTLPTTFEEFFKTTIQKVASATQRLPTQIVMVPAQRDVHHEPVYPQPPFYDNSDYKKIHFVSDPCTLKFDDVVFGITSTDILFHLGSDEISCPPGSSDRLGRLTQHLLTQHNYYPLYPPHEDVNVDYDHFEVYAQMPVRPHVLIVPSDLRYFIKDIEGCVCVNPGRLTKGHVGGTYSRIVIAPPTNAAPAVSKGICAEILRI